jgi:peroxiredoxin
MQRRRFIASALAFLSLGSLPAAAKGRAAAQDFSIKALSGKTMQLSKLRGEVVVINFWATWCRPCMQELPYLDAFHKKYGNKGLTVLAVATDGPETAAQVRSVVKRKKWKMPVIHDAAGKLVAQLNPRGNNPFTVFIDKRGRIAKVHEGYNSGDEKKYHKIIKNLLKEPTGKK